MSPQISVVSPAVAALDRAAMDAPVELPGLVRERVASLGETGQRWLAALGERLDGVALRWGLRLGDPFPGGTASLVLAATDPAGRPCIVKLMMPGDDGEDGFERTVLAHELADGRGCVRLLGHDASARALLLERLGPHLHALDLPLPDVLDIVAATLRDLWRPLPPEVDLPTGADQARWLAEHIVAWWDELGGPCSRAVVDRALACCEARAMAFDADSAVLVHGDAHGWNTLAAGDGGYRLVDPEGLCSERAHDLGILMREYNEPLLAGDTVRLVHERAEHLAAAVGDVDPEAVWQWGFVERVSTGLANLRSLGGHGGQGFLEVAERTR